jgi:hypothetical protein
LEICLINGYLFFIIFSGFLFLFAEIFLFLIVPFTVLFLFLLISSYFLIVTC